MKKHKWIWYIDDERDIGNSIIVGVIPGRKFSERPSDNEHVLGFDTMKEVLKAVRKSIPCNCEQCQQELKTYKKE